MVREEPLGHLLGGRLATDQRPGSLHDVPASAVVEGDGQRHPPVVGGQRRQILEILSQLTGKARVRGPQEAAADAAGEQQRRVLAHNPADQAHQKVDFGTRTVPVLGGEGVQAEPLDASGPGRLDDVDDGGLRSPMARRPGKRAPLSPAAVAVHHAGHVPRHRTHRPVDSPLLVAVRPPTRPVPRRRACALDTVAPHTHPRLARSGTVCPTALGHAHPVSPIRTPHRSVPLQESGGMEGS